MAEPERERGPEEEGGGKMCSGRGSLHWKRRSPIDLDGNPNWRRALLHCFRLCSRIENSLSQFAKQTNLTLFSNIYLPRHWHLRGPPTSFVHSLAHLVRLPTLQVVPSITSSSNDNFYEN
ncbi:Beta-cyclopiazonate dehydrogenase [Fusarium oxysporum f. sp. albedinis]|nr:Beta-cyclopiazonate dehydrogenase [Fusarium oxysporum f. sp. albedinis]